MSQRPPALPLADLLHRRLRALTGRRDPWPLVDVSGELYRCAELTARADLIGVQVDAGLPDDQWREAHTQHAAAYLAACHPRALETLALPLDAMPADLAADVALAAADVLDMTPVSAPVHTPLYAPVSDPLELPSDAPRLIGLCGGPRTGKDVVADYVQAHYRDVHRFAFSDAIIDEANDWLVAYGHRIAEANKSHPRYRHMLQAWGMGRRAQQADYWLDAVGRRIRRAWTDGARLVIVTGARMPNEVDLVIDHGGEMWRVKRPGNNYTFAAGAAAAVESALDTLPDCTFRTIVNPVEGDLAPYEHNIQQALSSAR